MEGLAGKSREPIAIGTTIQEKKKEAVVDAGRLQKQRRGKAVGLGLSL